MIAARFLKIGLFFVIVVGLSWFWLDFRRLAQIVKMPLKRQKVVQYGQVPTIFVHGYRGNRYSFGRMLIRFQKKGIAQKTMVVRIFEDGSFTYKGKIPRQSNNPCIQVLFQKNTATVQMQVQWLTGFLAFLKAQGCSTVNLVGHSMGAVSIVAYCAQKYRENQPQIQRVVTIAGPFNDLELGRDTPKIFSTPLTEEGPLEKTPIYTYLKKHMDRLPYSISFLNIVGTILPRSSMQHDGSVSMNSGLALKFILATTKHVYTQALIRGANAAHSLLHENSLVDWNISAFLWHFNDEK